MDSLWHNTVQLPHFEPLSGNKKTDVLIIGGGISGILCAYMLDRAGVDYALAEADRICGGVTGSTTAKITSQHGLIYHKLIRRFGTERAGMYLEANQKALEQYRSLCQSIDCDFEEKDSFVYSTANRRKIEQEMAALERLGFHADALSELPLRLPVAGAIRFPRQAQFNPLKFISAIANGLQIYEHTKVLELTPKGAVTCSGIITAEKIIVATHFPFLNKHGSYFLKLYQHRSYELALDNAPNVQGMYVDESQTGLSFQNYNGLLLLGGGGHRTGKKGGGWQELSDFVMNAYPDAVQVCRWATQDCMTLDGIPYVGQYCKRTPNLYVATGFNKWGMTSAMAAAMLLTDLVLGRENPYVPVYSPSRTILRPQLAVNAAETTINLLTPTMPRCPHLGCALKYNPQEHSWDCPCHGSRFSGSGTLLDNPSTGNLKHTPGDNTIRD